MNEIDMLLAMKGLQDKVETLVTEMTKATMVINQLQDNIEVLQVDHDKMVDVIQLQSKVNVKNINAILRLEKLQKEQGPFTWPGL